ncbi:hypothetical protein Jab_1c25010 [Janthinobacterium sp. HH01]|uniref:hypothetical protein n=1 Tax=Janthinobacterium sp. HH01 TaxID=1198452 RepID=UPI0002AEDAD3|nr:hypothetical protein [Janthinobacterium sp. HH01]ELX13861.1 hypothetical protein Jab_1c25010 [Janthinobacterium sp. HH01]
MKLIFVKDGLVVGHGYVAAAGVTIMSSVPGAQEHQVEDDTPVDIGWTCELVDGAPVFTPSSALPLLTPMSLYMAFTPAERIAIKASKDPIVAEFWSMYQLSVQLDKPTDPNLASVRDIIAYLAKPASPGPGGGILASPERVQQILAGIPQ